MTSGGTPSWVDAGGGGLLQLKQSQVTDSSSRITGFNGLNLYTYEFVYETWY